MTPRAKSEHDQVDDEATDPGVPFKDVYNAIPEEGDHEYAYRYHDHTDQNRRPIHGTNCLTTGDGSLDSVGELLQVGICQLLRPRSPRQNRDSPE